MANFIGVGTGTYPTLLDVTRGLDPQGNTDAVVELLQQTNAPILDIPWGESNLSNGERTTIRTGLPTGTWRQFYQGIPASKSEKAQITDSCGMLEMRSEIDKDEADLNGNTASYRTSESYAALEGMNQGFCNALFYGNVAVNKATFNGFAPRYSSLSAGNAQNIIDAKGTGSNLTSIWLVCWGQNTVYGIYPKGKKGGLNREDLGVYDAFDSNGDRYRAYGDLYKWDCGLTVKDWRYVVRICNIDVDALVSGTNAPDLVSLLIKALHRVPNIGIVQTGIQNAAANGAMAIPMAPNPVFYANRTVSEFIDLQTQAKTNYTLKTGNDVFGRPVTFVRGIPMRTCDQILTTESKVS